MRSGMVELVAFGCLCPKVKDLTLPLFHIVLHECAAYLLVILVLTVALI